MADHLFTRFDASQVRSTIILLASAVAAMAISLLVGISDNIPMILLLLAGIILFFYSVLNPWEKTGYYAILSVMCGALFLFLIFAGIGILVRMQLPGHMAEDIAMPFGMVCLAGLISGVIGMLRFRGYGREKGPSAEKQKSLIEPILISLMLLVLLAVVSGAVTFASK